MQGRLSKPRSSLIQEFPWEDWANEFQLAARCSLNCIEWTVDLNKFETNPIFDPIYREFIHQITQSNGITVESITLDNFVEAPLHKVNAKNNLNSDIKKLEWIVDRIRAHSIKTLVLPIVKENGEESEETLANLCQILADAQSFLEANSIFLALELELSIDQISNVVKSLTEYQNIGFNLLINCLRDLNLLQYRFFYKNLIFANINRLTFQLHFLIRFSLRFLLTFRRSSKGI